MVPAVEGRLAILAVFPISFVVVTALRWFIKKRRSDPSLPPGPVPIPLLGNILSIDTKEPWLTYTQWHAVYGDLVFARILDQNAIVINSQHVARALLEKRSAIYSDRPYIATAEPCGWSISFAIIGYNDEWRRCRRLFQQTFRPDSALKFRPMQMRRAREMIVNLVDDPEHYHSHFATLSSSVAMSTIYDYQLSARDDPLVHMMENAMTISLKMMTPERAALLKAFPFYTDFMRTKADGSSLGQSSMVAENLQRMEKHEEASRQMFETALKRTATTAMLGAYETTTSTLMAFALAMVFYPDVQRRAQAEIDSVIGRDRLPTFEDRTSLPYVESILRETLAISRDEKRYPDASRFMPERFLDVNGALADDDPAGYVFGSGRRACPGRYTVDSTLWSAIATMLATIEFSFAKDDEGKIVDFTPQFTTGLTQYFVSLYSFTLLSLIVSSL
ncbi:cytochrome P450 [Suillus decipiens]|nr:cytochrome P450 [Suillus decipiens]